MKPFKPPGREGGKLIRLVVAAFRGHIPKLEPHDRIGIAVSGGIDSLSLYLLLARHGRRLLRPEQVVLIHLDHGWVRGSEKTGLKLKKIAQKEGTAFFSEKLEPHLKKGESPEAQASKLRRARLLKIREALGLRLLVTAHHRDDLFETLLMQFLKGEPQVYENSGIYEYSDPWFRPLLRAQKAQLQAFLKEEGVKPIEDPTQKNTELLRNNLRAKALPALLSAFPAAVHAVTEPWFEPEFRIRIEDDGLLKELQAHGVRPTRATWQSIARLGVGKSLDLSKDLTVKRLATNRWHVCTRDSQHASLKDRERREVLK